MKSNSVQLVFWSLPYEVRRFLFRIYHPREYKSLQGMRTIKTDNGYSLQPFDRYKCIFVHIPKCAGISVCKSLFGNLAGHHLSIKKYQIVFSKNDFNSYFKFTFVRNPWDRLVSAYRFLKKGGFNESDRKWAEAKLCCYRDFDSFVKGWVTRENVQSWIHFIPQHKFIYGRSNELLLDFIGYFESLEKDFSYVQNKIRNSSRLMSLNRTRRNKRDYQDYYTDETKEIVGEVYHEDIEMLGYSFDSSPFKKKEKISTPNL